MLSCVLLISCKKGGLTLTVPEERVQAAVEKMFPIEIEERASLTLSEPQVILDANENRLGLKAKVATAAPPDRPALPRLPGGSREGALEVTLSVRFDGDQGAFYGDQPKVEALTLEGLPPKLSTAMGKAAEAALTLYLKRHAIYELSEEDLRQTAGRKLLKSVRVEEGELRVTLGL